ncbi:MAG: hypothetical protein ACLURK_06050 [Bifidobacterium sp.]
MAGAYTSSIIRETEELLTRLDDAGKQPELYVYGRRGVTYYKYRNRAIADTWEGDTDKPGVEIAEAISNALMTAYMKPASEGGGLRALHRLHRVRQHGGAEGARAAYASRRSGRGQGRIRPGHVARE